MAKPRASKKREPLLELHVPKRRVSKDDPIMQLIREDALKAARDIDVFESSTKIDLSPFARQPRRRLKRATEELQHEERNRPSPSRKKKAKK